MNYKIFLSFANNDQDFALTVKENLMNWGYAEEDIWLYIESSSPGSRWRDEIEDALKACDLVLGVLSSSAKQSIYTKAEWNWASDNNRPLILLRIEDILAPYPYNSDTYIDFVEDQEEGFLKLKSTLSELFAIEKSTTLTKEVRDHVEKYWLLSKKFFTDNDYALAAFFAIALLKEIGLMMLLTSESKGEIDKSKLAEISDEDKLMLTVGQTLLVNSRVQKIYDDVDEQFKEWYRDKKLGKIQHKALYIDVTAEPRSIAPNQSISREDAFVLVCLAGECYAEIQGNSTGVSSNDWQRIIGKVDQFRDTYWNEIYPPEE